MANVRLLNDFGGHKAGEVVTLPATVARDLIYKNQALDGEAVSKSWKPGMANKKTDEKVNKPTKTNTVNEIKAYLDGNDVEYPAGAKKDELLDLID